MRQLPKSAPLPKTARCTSVVVTTITIFPDSMSCCAGSALVFRWGPTLALLFPKLEPRLLWLLLLLEPGETRAGGRWLHDRAVAAASFLLLYL